MYTFYSMIMATIHLRPLCAHSEFEHGAEGSICTNFPDVCLPLPSLSPSSRSSLPKASLPFLSFSPFPLPRHWAIFLANPLSRESRSQEQVLLPRTGRWAGDNPRWKDKRMHFCTALE